MKVRKDNTEKKVKKQNLISPLKYSKHCLSLVSSYDRKRSFVAFSVTREKCTSVYLENKPPKKCCRWTYTFQGNYESHMLFMAPKTDLQKYFSSKSIMALFSNRHKSSLSQLFKY